MNQTQLLQAAQAVLYANRRNHTFTIPTARLYPFQWNWDSGFTALGYMHEDLEAAMAEIQSLLSGQWENGMIPHILFHSETEDSYFPNWDFWKTEVNAGAPQQPRTSGISQPPVIPFVLEEMHKTHPNNEKLGAFIRAIFPQLVQSQRFWYQYRDPHKEGLVFIYHPWESGRDNSPIWDDALSLIKLDRIKLPPYQRKDTAISDSSERPTHTQYDQYVYLLLLGQKHQYDGPGIADESEFLIQDSLINALLIKCNESLIHLGQKMGLDIGEVKEWQQQSKIAYQNKLWNATIENYSGYDLRQQKALPHWEIGALTALSAGIPDQNHADKVHRYLDRLVKDEFLLTPSFDVYHPLYDSKRYWRGPIWPQMNWLVHNGLERYGFDEMAAKVKADLIQLVRQFGFREYFEAQKHLVEQGMGGYGGNHFSWTAACIIDFLQKD